MQPQQQDDTGSSQELAILTLLHVHVHGQGQAAEAIDINRYQTQSERQTMKKKSLGELETCNNKLISQIDCKHRPE